MKPSEWCWCVLWLVLAIPAMAGEPPAGTAANAAAPAVQMQAVMVGPNPFRPQGNSTEFPVTVYMQGEAVRVDFNGPNGERGLLLHDAASQNGWLVSLDEGRALPIGEAGFHDLRVDPRAPCQNIGVRCQPAGERFVAGVLASGWRYRNADGRGPGGTSNGDFWIDPVHGAVLAYRGRMRDRAKVREWRVKSVAYDPLPAVLFELPRTIAVPDDMEGAWAR